MQSETKQSAPAAQTPVKVYFFGSGRLAVPVLERLAFSPEIDLLETATQPDRPAGRKRRPQSTPVGEFAAANKLPLIKPENVNTSDFAARVNSLRPEIAVVAAFGQILKKNLLETPEFGCLNVHASLLPYHRGAAPVAGAILAGDAETGVSFMRMDAGLDTGPVYSRVRLPITGEDTAGQLEEKLAQLASDNITTILHRVCREGLQPRAQDHGQATHSGKISKHAGRLDWSLPAYQIERCIRAYYPWPKVSFQLETKNGGKRRIQIIKGAPAADAAGKPGTVCRVTKESFTIACGQGGIRVEKLIPEGGRAMTAAEFLRGSTVEEGQVIS